jgi:hypothetical protein
MNVAGGSTAGIVHANKQPSVGSKPLPPSVNRPFGIKSLAARSKKFF